MEEENKKLIIGTAGGIKRGDLRARTDELLRKEIKNAKTSDVKKNDPPTSKKSKKDQDIPMKSTEPKKAEKPVPSKI